MKNLKIYQLDLGKGREKLYRSFDEVNVVDMDNYNLVYETTWDVKKDIFEELEDIFRVFNIAFPEDYKGRSLSVSDIVEIDGDKYYVDSIGFKKFDRHDK